MNLPNVLMIDDDPRFCMAMSKALRRRGFDVDVFHESYEAIEALSSATEETVAVLDLKMPHHSGLEILRATPQRRVPVLMLTGHGAVPDAVAAMREGAYTFLTKPIDAADLAPMIIQAYQDTEVGRTVTHLIGESREAKRIRQMISSLSSVDEIILILGETGTGKEVVARSVHESRCGEDQPFISINMATLSPDRFELELFGQAQGRGDEQIMQSGLLDKTGQGTLFLDEVGEIPYELQAKLLRVIDHGVYRPVGSAQDRAFKGQLVAATNRNLEEEVHEGRFREDLFHRINVFPLYLSPLRKREDDSVLILQHWFEKITGNQLIVEGNARHHLTDHSWLGNAREVVNLARRLAVQTAEHRSGSAPVLLDVNLLDSSLDPHLFCGQKVHVQPSMYNGSKGLLGKGEEGLLGEDVSLELIEREHISRLLTRHGNLSHVARILNVNRRTLQRKLKVWGDG